MKFKSCVATTIIIGVFFIATIGCEDEHVPQRLPESERQSTKNEGRLLDTLLHIKDMAKLEGILEDYWNQLETEKDPKRVKEVKEVLKYYGNQGGFVVNGEPLRELVRDLD